MISRQHTLRILFLITLTALFTFGAAYPVDAQSSDEKDTIRVLILDNFPPQFISTPDGPSGLAVEVVREVAQRISLDIEFVTVKGWKDVYAPLENRTVDVLSSMGVTEARQKLVEFTEPYEVFDYKLFVRRETTDLETLASLNGRMLGVQDTNFLTKKLVKSGKYNIKSYPSFQAAFLGLLAGEIDAIHAPTEPFLLIARAARLDDRIKAVGPSLHEVKRAMAVPKGRTELRDRLNKGLNEFKNTAEYQSLLTKWYGKPTPYWTPVKIFFAMGSVLLASLLIMGVWRYYSVVGLNRNLRQSEYEYHNILNTMIDVFYRTDLEGHTIIVSPSVQKLLGYKPEELIGTKLAERYVDPYGREKFLTDLAEANGVIVGHEAQLRKKDGSVIWVQTNSQYYYDRDGQVAGVEGIARDITERKQAEQDLKESDVRYRLAVELTNVGHWVWDEANNKSVFCSEEMARIHGVSVEEYLASTSSVNGGHIWVHPDDQKRLILVFKKLAEQKSDYDVEYRIITRAGEVRHVREIGKTDFDENGIYVRSRGVLQDITEQKVTEEQLRHSQKIEAIGQLTGGIAHDFNNILGVIMGNLEIVQNMDSGDQNFLIRIKKALKGVNRGADITRKLLDFSRKDEHGKILSSINQLIETQKDFIAKSLTASIKVETQLSDNLWPVTIDPGDLEDAILNLSLNARDAMPEGGVLIIETANKILDESYVKLTPGSEVGDFVMISVSDTGTGMSKETQERALDPFFTTKEQGQGTGLGLSMVYGFIRRSGGHLKIYSEIGNGTTFHLYLPRTREGASADDAENGVHIDPPRGTETILIVDDEEELLDITATYLEYLGYKVLLANESNHALKVLKDNRDIDLMFSDVIMPGNMDGYQLALAAHEEYPALKVLMTSGFTNKREEQVNGDKKHITQLVASSLSKPYNQLELALAIRNSLDHET